jgi:hypothetical protein
MRSFVIWDLGGVLISYRVKENEWMSRGIGVEVRKAYKTLILKSEPKRPLGAPR